jgi:hypothetical protein
MVAGAFTSVVSTREALSTVICSEWRIGCGGAACSPVAGRGASAGADDSFSGASGFA